LKKKGHLKLTLEVAHWSPLEGECIGDFYQSPNERTRRGTPRSEIRQCMYLLQWRWWCRTTTKNSRTFFLSFSRTFVEFVVPTSTGILFFIVKQDDSKKEYHKYK